MPIWRLRMVKIFMLSVTWTSSPIIRAHKMSGLFRRCWLLPSNLIFRTISMYNRISLGSIPYNNCQISIWISKLNLQCHYGGNEVKLCRRSGLITLGSQIRQIEKINRALKHHKLDKGHCFIIRHKSFRSWNLLRNKYWEKAKKTMKMILTPPLKMTHQLNLRKAKDSRSNNKLV